MSKSEKHYKPQTIRIRLSTPFLVRTKCKFCKTEPSLYYYTYNVKPQVSHRWMQDHFSIVTKRVKRLTQDWYLITDPKYYTAAGSFAQGTVFKQYDPKIHHTRGIDADNYIVEHLTCDCGRSTWAFAEKACSNRPEITNRKARHRFPQKFDHW